MPSALFHFDFTHTQWAWTSTGFWATPEALFTMRDSVTYRINHNFDEDTTGQRLRKTSRKGLRVSCLFPYWNRPIFHGIPYSYGTDAGPSITEDHPLNVWKGYDHVSFGDWSTPKFHHGRQVNTTRFEAQDVQSKKTIDVHMHLCTKVQTLVLYNLGPAIVIQMRYESKRMHITVRILRSGIEVTLVVERHECAISSDLYYRHVVFASYRHPERPLGLYSAMDSDVSVNVGSIVTMLCHDEEMVAVFVHTGDERDRIKSALSHCK